MASNIFYLFVKAKQNKTLKKRLHDLGLKFSRFSFYVPKCNHSNIVVAEWEKTCFRFETLQRGYFLTNDDNWSRKNIMWRLEEWTRQWEKHQSIIIKNEKEELIITLECFQSWKCFPMTGITVENIYN